jgi:hypothetical protein
LSVFFWFNGLSDKVQKSRNPEILTLNPKVLGSNPKVWAVYPRIDFPGKITTALPQTKKTAA